MARKDNLEDRGLYEHPKGSRVWWVLWYDHRGKRHRKKIGTKTAARHFYQKMKGQVNLIKERPELAEQLFPTRKKGLTLGEVIASYLPDFEKKASSANLLAYAAKWTKLLGDLPINEVSREHAKKRQAALLAKPVKPATVNRDIAFIKMVLAKALEDGLIAQNPLARFRMLKENNCRDRWVNEAEEDRVESHLTPEGFDLVAIAIDTGLRQAEQFGLAWPQINFAGGGWISITKAKGDKSRTVPLTPRALAILQRRHAARTSSFVFPNKAGKPMDPQNFINRHFYPALEAAGLQAGEATPDGIVWHTLRHTCGSRMALKGVSLQKIGKVLGHSRAETSARYSHLLPESSREAVSALIRDEDSRGGLRLVK